MKIVCTKRRLFVPGDGEDKPIASVIPRRHDVLFDFLGLLGLILPSILHLKEKLLSELRFKVRLFDLLFGFK